MIAVTVRQVEEAGARDERVFDTERRHPVLREGVRLAVVSSLAEGSDRIVAEAGLAAGFELDVILPFDRAEYAKDFHTHAARAKFEHLLARASWVSVLPGVAGERPPAYEAAGLLMLAKSDLLIAIWDGERAAGIGGTARIVARAIADGIPVIRIDPANPSATQIARRQADGSPPPSADATLNDRFRPGDDATIGMVIRQIL